MAIQIALESDSNVGALTGFLTLFAEGSTFKYKDQNGQTYSLSTGVTPEEVQDLIAQALTSTGTVTFTYDDNANTISADFSGNTDDIPEGVNKFVSASQKSSIDTALQPGSNISQLVNDLGFVQGSDLVIGDELEYDDDLTPFSTTANFPVDASNFTIPPKKPGVYLILTEFIYKPSATNADDRYQWQMDGVDIGKEHVEEGKDTSSAQSKTVVKILIANFNTIQPHTLSLITSQEGGGTTIIKEVSYVMWRMSV